MQNRLLILILLLVNNNFSFGQVPDSLPPFPAALVVKPDFLKLSVEVKSVDSQYILITHLQVLKKDTVIQIHKLLYTKLDGGIDLGEFSDIMITIRKNVRCVFQDVFVEMIRDPQMDDGFVTYRDFKYGDSLNDSTNLDEFCVFEVGSYDIDVYLDYVIGGEHRRVKADTYFFDVPFLPKKSMWEDECKFSKH